MPFQATQVNNDLPLAISGDYASSNPRSALVGIEGQYVAATGGLTIGQFCWVQADGRSLGNLPPNGVTTAPDGFVHRAQQALITTYLAEYGNVIQAGFPAAAMTSGDYFQTSPSVPTRGQKVFASLTVAGQITYGAAGATVAGYVETNFAVDVPAPAVNTLSVITSVSRSI
jgi:hypothetical protein